MTKKTQDIEELTLTALKKVPEPRPDYITLLVFLAIEKDEDLLRQYQVLVDKYNQLHGEGEGKGHVNNTIPQIIKRETGRTTGKSGIPARSSLIKTYSKLV